MRLRRQSVLVLCAAIACLGIFRAGAQYGDTGTVTGHVYCADTEKPARFANVRLQPVDAQGVRFGGRGGFATTGSDGSFRLTGISPGDYYADVMMPGYVQPMRGLLRDIQNLTPAERDQLTSQLTRVTVSANQATNVQVMIYRGATISGTVTFDDGGPASGVSIQGFMLPPATAGQPSGSTQQQQGTFAGFAQTDDRGQYRLTGLADGTYIVFASPRSIFPIYFGNTIERSSAKKIDIHAGDEVPGTDIQIPATGMHRVSGFVVSQQDGHPLSRASLQLRLSSGDGTSIGATTASDGSFSFAAVPDGKFNVQITSAYDPATRESYSSSQSAVEVNGGDISDLVVNAVPQQ